MSDLMLDVDQAGELKAAFRRGDWTNAEIKRACEGNFLAQVRKVLLGQAQIVDVVKKVTEVVKAVKKVLTPFITITTGGTTTDQLVVDIKANKNENGVADEVSDYAKSMMTNKAFTISKEVGTADLVALTIAELGFASSPRTDEFMTAEFCAKWSAENLDGMVIELCQPEDGPQLRKQWKDQPKGMAVWLAMKRISDSGGVPRVWRVECLSDGPRWLSGIWARPGRRWVLGDRVVFRFRKI